MNYLSGYNFPIHYKYQYLSVKVLTLPQERAHLYDSNDTLQTLFESEVSFPFTLHLGALQKIKFPIGKKYKGILYKVVLWS